MNEYSETVNADTFEEVREHVNKSVWSTIQQMGFNLGLNLSNRETFQDELKEAGYGYHGSENEGRCLFIILDLDTMKALQAANLEIVPTDDGLNVHLKIANDNGLREINELI